MPSFSAILLIFLALYVNFVLALRFLNRGKSRRRRAEKLIDFNKAVFDTPHLYRSTDPLAFRHIRLDWYGKTRDHLLQKGFRFLGDFEDVTVNQFTPFFHPVFISAMVSSDSTITACAYQAKRRMLFSVLLTLGGSGRSSLISSLDLSTEFRDGTFLSTTSNPLAHTFRQYPGIQRVVCPPDAPYDYMLRVHQESLRDRLDANPDVSPLRIQSIEDVYQSNERERILKQMHMKSTGYVDPGQILRLANEHQQTAAVQLVEEVVKIQAEVKND